MDRVEQIQLRGPGGTARLLHEVGLIKKIA